MNDMNRLNARLRAIKLVGLGVIALTLLAWGILTTFRTQLNGLLLGEMGGAYVVYSMIRQGHLRDGLQGKALFASGILGMVTRFVVLIAVLIVALKTPHVSAVAALVGYLFGFVLVFLGLYGYARNRTAISGEK